MQKSKFLRKFKWNYQLLGKQNSNKKKNEKENLIVIKKSLIDF